MFAPPYMLRAGLVYGLRKAKVSFLGTFMARHNAQDDGKYVTKISRSDSEVPSYATWDLTAEIPIHKRISVMAGINNLFDRQYYSRVTVTGTATGIDPSYGRNVYAGFSVQF